MDGTGSSAPPRVLREVVPERRWLALRFIRSADAPAPAGTWWELADPATDPDEAPDAVVVTVRTAAGVVELATFVLAKSAAHGTANDAADQLVATLRRSNAALVHCSLTGSNAEVRDALIGAGFVALHAAEDHSNELLVLQL